MPVITPGEQTWCSQRYPTHLLPALLLARALGARVLQACCSTPVGQLKIGNSNWSRALGQRHKGPRTARARCEQLG